MPGTLILRPIKANLLNDHHQFLKMDPYCTISLGVQQVESKVCKNGGKTPEWEDQIILRRGYEPYCTIQIKDKEFFKSDSTVGTAQIDLREIESSGKLTKWYKLGSNTGDSVAGEILIEATFAKDAAGTFKALPQQQSYSYLSGSHKSYTQNLYPSNIYSPGKRSSMGLDRQLQQMPEKQIPGYHNKDQLITYPHISHHLSRDEYSKMHSRNVERYQPTNKVVPDQKKPPTWEGYSVPEHLLPHESPKKEETQDVKQVVEPVEVGKKAARNITASTLDSVDTMSNDKKSTTSIEKISSTEKTPVSKRREVTAEETQQSPGGIKFYPMISGVSYRPTLNEATYKPVYNWPAKSEVARKELEKETAKNQRKLSANSSSTGGEKAGNNSTMGSLGAIGGSSLNTLDVV